MVDSRTKGNAEEEVVVDCDKKERGKRGKVLTEAFSAGLASALAAFLCFPLETLRTQQQTSSLSPSPMAHEHVSYNNRDETWLCFLLRQYLKPAAFIRMGHISVCSFVYFSVYEAMKKLFSHSEKSFSWCLHFILSGIACLVTVLLTQCLESYIYREQALPGHDACLWADSLSSSSVLSSLLSSAWCELSMSMNDVLPSLVLCVNPSLYMTFYDGIKWRILKLRRSRKQEAAPEVGTLTALQAFLLGFLSKAAVTIITYPLIRAKMMMIKPDHNDNISTEVAASVSNPLWSLLSNRLFFVVKRMINEEGIFGEGIWRGICIHVLHSSLRDAASMAMKELMVGFAMTQKAPKSPKPKSE